MKRRKIDLFIKRPNDEMFSYFSSSERSSTVKEAIKALENRSITVAGSGQQASFDTIGGVHSARRVYTFDNGTQVFGTFADKVYKG